MTPESELDRLLNCARMFTGLKVPDAPQRYVPLTDAELAAKVAETEKRHDA